MNATSIVLGALGGVMSTVTEALKDKKITIGEIWEMPMTVGREIVKAIPGAGTFPVYRVGGDWKNVNNLLRAIDKTVAKGLKEFGVADLVVGKV